MSWAAERAGVARRGPVPWLPGWQGVLAAAVAGVLHAASFAPLELWWLQVLATGVLVALLADASPRAAALRGWAFGAGWLLAGLWWIYISLHVYGLLPAWLSALAVALLAMALALYYGLAAWGWARLRRRRPQVDALLFAAAWLLAELARGAWFTGFPWIAGGYAHTTGPLARWAPYVGVYGLGAFAAWIAASVALTIRAASGTRRAEARAWAPLALPAALLLGGLALPQDFTRSTGTISVSLLQTNVAQDVKFEDAEVRKALAWHVQALAQAPGQLVVTPESSLPIPAGDIPRDVWQAYEKPFAVPGRAALVGVFTGDDHVGYTNSVVGLDALQRESDGTAFHYGKRHLLPFGEFVPPGFQWMLDMMKVPIGSQARGTETGSLAVAGQRVRTMICYEDLFGDELAASMVGPGAATLMANVSNLAWFGTLEVQDQHLQFSRMRALEFQRGQVRATNTGATAVIDWHGRVTDRLPPAVEGRLDARVEGRIGDTPYARWVSEWHLWPLWWLGGFLLLAGAMLRRR